MPSKKTKHAASRAKVTKSFKDETVNTIIFTLVGLVVVLGIIAYVKNWLPVQYSQDPAVYVQMKK